MSSSYFSLPLMMVLYAYALIKNDSNAAEDTAKTLCSWVLHYRGREDRYIVKITLFLLGNNKCHGVKQKNLIKSGGSFSRGVKEDFSKNRNEEREEISCEYPGGRTLWAEEAHVQRPCGRGIQYGWSRTDAGCALSR
jgi:hypothetical protein